MPLQGKYEIKLGRSFLASPQTSFMTMRCDFLPASVNRNEPGKIKITNDKEVGIKLPNVNGAEASCTMFKGNIRPVQKECLLIFNKKTGELILERISKAAQLKKTRDDLPVKKHHTNPQSKPYPKSKARTISDSSSDKEKSTFANTKRVPANRSIINPRSPIDAATKHASTLSSSSSDSDSVDTNKKIMGFSNKPIPTNAGLSHENSDLSSLSSLEDSCDPPLTKKAHNIPSTSPKAVHLSNRKSPDIHRSVVEDDLQLSESDSD